MKLKHNQSKEFLLREKKNLEDYMLTLGPGDEYDHALLQWKAINDELERMSISNKLKGVLPWLTLGVSAVGSIFVPIALGKLAYRNSEEQGKLKNGDVWREAISNTQKPSVPDNRLEEKKESNYEALRKQQNKK